MKKALKDQLRILSQMSGVTGNEEVVVRYMRDEFLKYTPDVKVDSMGNLYAYFKGAKPGKKLLLVAHSDEVGYTVKSILDNGFILFDKAGTLPDKVMEGRKVIINSTIPGVIGIKPGHLQTATEASTALPAKKGYIDVAANSKEEVLSMGIEIGSPVSFVSEFTEMYNPDYVCSKSIDNRVNCGILLELAKKINCEEISGEICLAVSAQEEVGMKGAFVLANTYKADYAIVIDTIPSGDTPDIDYHRELSVRLADGPVLVVGSDFGPALLSAFSNKKINTIIKTIAKTLNIKLQSTTVKGAAYATDADRITSAGIPCGILAIPRRYSHSPVEVANMNDILDTFNVLYGVIENNSDHIDLDFV